MEQQVTGDRLLLISPVFHDYWRSIERAFQALGFDTQSVCYDRYSVSDRIWNKLANEIRPAATGTPSTRWQAHIDRRVVAAIRQYRPTHVLVVRGDSLGASVWEAAQESAEQVAIWTYDELARLNYHEEALRAVAGVATYSRTDAAHLSEQGINSAHVPLAYEDISGVTPASWGRVREVSFAGARYPNRVRLLQQLADGGIPVHAYGRTWSHAVIDRLRTLEWERPSLPSDGELSLEDAHRVMAESAATLNIHAAQVVDGFTMRTFEACGVGALQLIDRSDVDAFYDIGTEVLVFQDPQEAIELCQRALKDVNWGAAIRRAGRERTLAEHTFVHRARDIARLWGG